MTSITNIKENNKIERKKFFIYSGAAAFGIFALIKNPFKLLGKNQSDEKPQQYSGTIRITQNPNAVRRNTTKLNNG